MRPTVKTWAYKKCAHHRAKLFADILNALVHLPSKHAIRHAEVQSMKKRLLMWERTRSIDVLNCS